MKNIKGLHVLTDREMVKPRTIIEVIEMVIQGGASVIQLRDKNIVQNESIELGKELIRLINGRVPLIVDDNIEVALTIGAQGVHVGQKDMSAKKVRKLIGSHMILGVSAHTVKQAIKAETDNADYIGVGPIYRTESKLDAASPIGLSGLNEIKNAVSIPVIAIGGISIDNAVYVARIADGIAVISVVLKEKDPKKVTQELAEIIKKYHEQK